MNIGDTFFRSLSERGDCSPAERKCLASLDAMGLAYAGLTHDAADTIALCEEIEKKLGAPIVKNLFLCNQQKTAFYLLLMPGDKPFKTKFLSKQIGSARLSFADAGAMESLLGVTPGSVSVFGLLNDNEKRVRLLFDGDILLYPVIGAHPCKNTATLRVSMEDILQKFLPALGVTPTVVTLPSAQELERG